MAVPLTKVLHAAIPREMEFIERASFIEIYGL